MNQDGSLLLHLSCANFSYVDLAVLCRRRIITTTRPIGLRNRQGACPAGADNLDIAYATVTDPSIITIGYKDVRLKRTSDCGTGGAATNAAVANSWH